MKKVFILFFTLLIPSLSFAETDISIESRYEGNMRRATQKAQEYCQSRLEKAKTALDDCNLFELWENCQKILEKTEDKLCLGHSKADYYKDQVVGMLSTALESGLIDETLVTLDESLKEEMDEGIMSLPRTKSYKDKVKAILDLLVELGNIYSDDKYASNLESLRKNADELASRSEEAHEISWSEFRNLSVEKKIWY